MKTATITRGSLRATAREQLGRDLTSNHAIQRRLALKIAAREGTTLADMPDHRFGPISDVARLAQQLLSLETVEIEVSNVEMVEGKPVTRMVKVVADTWPFALPDVSDGDSLLAFYDGTQDGSARYLVLLRDVLEEADTVPVPNAPSMPPSDTPLTPSSQDVLTDGMTPSPTKPSETAA